ncbi:hypothetical protein [Fusicatenibacter saccharivorans]|uniref:hypothetical protein n=1 Tax=Fusicatenibacter saccharivorans TaxID=1150298 RepID=UPI003F914457
MRNGRKHEGSASYRMNHRQHPDVIQSVAVAYAVLFLKLENIGLNKIKVSEMGKYFDVLRIIVSASKEGVVHNRSFFVILTTDSFEALTKISIETFVQNRENIGLVFTAKKRLSFPIDDRYRRIRLPAMKQK